MLQISSPPRSSPSGLVRLICSLKPAERTSKGPLLHRPFFKRSHEPGCGGLCGREVRYSQFLVMVQEVGRLLPFLCQSVSPQKKKTHPAIATFQWISVCFGYLRVNCIIICSFSSYVHSTMARLQRTMMCDTQRISTTYSNTLANVMLRQTFFTLTFQC